MPGSGAGNRYCGSFRERCCGILKDRTTAKPFSTLTELLSRAESMWFTSARRLLPTGVGYRALEAGCHLYVEKPFAESRSDAERILQLGASSGSLSPLDTNSYLRSPRESRWR